MTTPPRYEHPTHQLGYDRAGLRSPHEVLAQLHGRADLDENYWDGYMCCLRSAYANAINASDSLASRILIGYIAKLETARASLSDLGYPYIHPPFHD